MFVSNGLTLSVNYTLGKDSCPGAADQHNTEFMIWFCFYVCTSVLLFLLIDFLFFQFVLIFVFLAFLRMRKKIQSLVGRLGGIGEGRK